MFADVIAANDKRSATTIRDLNTQRFAVSDGIIKLCLNLMVHYGDKLQSGLEQTVLPAERTWLEFNFQNYTYGVLMIGQPSEVESKPGAPLIRACHVVAYALDKTTGAVHAIPPFFFDFAGDRIAHAGTESEAEVTQQKIAITWAAVVLNVLNEPKISMLRPSQLAKLNKARAKRGKGPYLEYREVFVTPEAKGAAIGSPVATGGTKKYHHVRTFVRIRKGKLEIVRPHWRGDASKGMIVQRHTIKLKGERK